MLLTPVVFVPMLLIHGLLPTFPWWALDAAGIVALAALWAYTERFPWARTGSPSPARGITTTPAERLWDQSGHLRALTPTAAPIGALWPICER
ncbi:MAG TPA: hypothetical protein VF637_11030 [Sphingomicrobium sp.]